MTIIIIEMTLFRRFSLILVILGLILYSVNLSNPLFWDDREFILNNKFVHSLSINNLVSMFTENMVAGAGLQSEYYRPLSLLSFGLNFFLHNDHPLGYHLFNNFLHITNALLVFILLHKLFKNPLHAFLTAMFFVIHPLNTQAVTYISGRDTPLASFFLLCSLILYTNHKILLSILLFIPALFSRETTIVFPGVILLIQFIKNKRFNFKHLSIYALISSIYILVRLTLLNFNNTLNLADKNTEYAHNLFDRLTTFIGIISHYLELILIPHGLHFRNETPVYTSILEPRVLVSIAILIALGATLIHLKKNNSPHFPVWSLGLGWFFVNLGLVSGVIPLHFSIQEHWVYLPMIGIYTIIAHHLSHLIKSKFKQITILVIICYSIYLGIYTIQRNLLWKNPIALWEDILRYELVSSKLLSNLGLLYLEKGNTEKANHYFAQAVVLGADFPEVYYNFAGTLWSQGEIDKALSMFDYAIKADPNFIKAYMNAAGMLGEKNRWSEAIPYLEKALVIDKDNSSLIYSLSLALAIENQSDRALLYINKGLSLCNKNLDLCNKFTLLKERL